LYAKDKKVPLKKGTRFEQLELFNKVLHLVETQYYRQVDTSKLIEGAIKGMMETLDPHSAFLNKEFFKKMKDDTSGEFGGLGIEVTMKDGIIYVVTPIEDSPAYKVGIKARDKIVEIDHESILGWTLDQAIEKMKGKESTKIHLGVIREGVKGLKHFELKRQKIKIQSVKSDIVEDDFIFLRLVSFQERSSQSIIKHFKKQKKIIEKRKRKPRGVILDLRSNPGGLLKQAVNVSSIFLEDGVVVSMESRDPKKKDIHYVKKSGFKETKLPMIVLINGASASASEIVAGALQDHKRAIIAGSTSFGKGSVQTVAQIDKQSGIKLTIAQYMTAKGRKIQALGIKPDIEIPEGDNFAPDDLESRDRYLRERDLRNHLSATIETKEEMTDRLGREKQDRIKRAERIKQARKSKKKKKVDDEIFVKFDPKTDFQVLQSINYLKSFTLYQNFLK
ncbi:S41 family peptidase, partial [Bacteriovoracaceae bacterium]|nr:S41 family peptidase [Bacteriovoracaceae bacterium]